MKKQLIITTTLLIYNLLNAQNNFIVAFGSGNKQNTENIFWDDILKLKPDVWIWGGDNISASTYDMNKMKTEYLNQKKQKGYAAIEKNISVIGTWNNCDYNTAENGKEFKKKKESQQLFLDFLNVPKNSSRRKQEGIYNSKNYKSAQGNIKIITLDTRYFRTKLTKNEDNKHYKPNKYNEGTILGNTQWKWLEKELKTSKADFNIIVSSIQVLANEHEFEKWGNFPHEIIKLFKTIKNSKAKNVIFLSGDRHQSEISKTMIENLNYPIIDFTSSGLTETTTKNKEETNVFRDGKLITEKNFGVLKFDFTNKKVTFQIRGDNNIVLEEVSQIYP